jgi:hypothetical protein
MAKKTGRGTPADAIGPVVRYVRRGAAAIQSRDANTGKRRAEYLALIDWAHARRRLIESSFLDAFAYKGSGAEHRVFHDPKRKRAIKVTHPNGFGYSAFGPGHVATPVEYLKRLFWCNRILGDDFKLLGIIHDGEQLQVVSSQPWINAHESRPHPEVWEIDAYFAEFGFDPAYDDPSVPIYSTPDAGLLVVDAHDHNVIRDEKGRLAAIDVVIGAPGAQLKQEIRAVLSRRR